MRTSWVALGIVMLAWALPARSASVVLARDGQPRASIVLPAEAAEPLRTAARDLQAYVRAICGVELPVLDDGRTVEGCGLYIGACGPAQPSDLPDATANPETAALRVRDGNILFAGRWPTPTAFAVYSFLEDTLGVRWFAPGRLWEHVPKGTPGVLTVEVAERVMVPGTSPRVWSGHAWTPDWKAWSLRNKAVLSEVVPRRQFQNNLHRVFPPATYGKTHPEYYPLINGERWIPGKDAGTHWRPCEGNPDVQRLTVEYARRWFDQNPNIDSFSVGMDDIARLCSCEQCRAWDPAPDSYEQRQFSNRHYTFVNAIAREIAKTHPERYVGTLIYNIARQLPEKVDRLEPNVFGFITETSGAWWMPGRREEDHALTREWARRCRHLSRYDYYGFASIGPRFIPHSMAEQIAFDKALGMEGMYVEVYTFLPHTAPMIWAMARLQWDHTQDIDALLSEFYQAMYGPSAGLMEQYFNLLERSYNVERPGRGAWEHRNLRNQALSISPEDLDAGLALLDRATAAAADDDTRNRIDVHRGALQYASYAVKANAISSSLISLAVTDEASAVAALEQAERLSTLAAEREVFWTAAMERQDLLGETLRGLGGMGYLATGQIASLERGGPIGVMKALGWYSRMAPDQLQAVARRLAERPGGSVNDTIRAWLWAQEAKPENLVANAGFEDRGANQAEAEKDWSTAGAPAGWSTWSSTPGTRFELMAGQGRQDSVAAALAGARSSACFLQTVPAKAGERFLVMCWVRLDPSNQPGASHLTVRFRDSKGTWHRRRDLEPTLEVLQDVADWQPVVVVLTMPEDGGSLVVMPGARGMAEAGRVFFDDLAVYRLPETF